MAAPLASLMMSDSSNEEIVALFVRVAGITRRHSGGKRSKTAKTKTTHHAVRFATTDIWSNALFGTEFATEDPDEAAQLG